MSNKKIQLNESSSKGQLSLNLDSDESKDKGKIIDLNSYTAKEKTRVLKEIARQIKSF